MFITAVHTLYQMVAHNLFVYYLKLQMIPSISGYTRLSSSTGIMCVQVHAEVIPQLSLSP